MMLALLVLLCAGSVLGDAAVELDATGGVAAPRYSNTLHAFTAEPQFSLRAVHRGTLQLPSDTDFLHVNVTYNLLRRPSVNTVVTAVLCWAWDGRLHSESRASQRRVG
jgi:hypothetical protein